jgi:CRP-like cAMP-binding protein
MIYTNKEIARKFIGMLASHLYEAENTMFELAYQSVRQRVANILIKLDVPLSAPQNEATSISVARKDLSKMVGTSTESLNRTLADFKDEGLIELHEKMIKIVQRSRLERATR